MSIWAFQAHPRVRWTRVEHKSGPANCANGRWRIHGGSSWAIRDEQTGAWVLGSYRTMRAAKQAPQDAILSGKLP